MPELLDRDAVGADEERLPSATVAFHAVEGMVPEGHAAGMETSEGTTSLFQHTPRWTRMSLIEVIASGAVAAAVADAFAAAEDAPEGQVISVLPADAPPDADDGDGDEDAAAMLRMARQAVESHGATVEVPRPLVPELTDEPVENVRRLFDLTYAEFGRLFGITERHAYRWHEGNVPAARRRAVDALQAVGMTIVGGLGPQGAKLWLRSGRPTGAELLAAGRLDELIDRADEATDSPAT